jgi:hypothetical protein
MRRFVPALAAFALFQCCVAIAQGHAVVPRTVADVTQMLAERGPDPSTFKRFADELAAPAPPETIREALIFWAPYALYGDGAR